MGKLIDLTDDVFGSLTVISRAENTKNGQSKWLCRCECGNTSVVAAANLKSRSIKSCGCLQGKGMLTHGMSQTRFWYCWRQIKSKCDNPNSFGYKDYGGRGITYDVRWRRFENFLLDMREGYSDTLTIDRIDTNGNYCKENCRWATDSVQAHNKRKREGCLYKYIGVSFTKRVGKWRARISIEGITHHIGYFISEVEAATAYDDKSQELYGDRPNKTLQTKENT